MRRSQHRRERIRCFVLEQGLWKKTVQEGSEVGWFVVEKRALRREFGGVLRRLRKSVERVFRCGVWLGGERES